MEYEDVIKVEAEHKAQEELEIDLEDLEDELMKKNQNQNKNQIMVSRTHVMKATVTVMLKNELFDNELFNS